MKAAVTITIDTDDLASLTDDALASFWHVSQVNPAPFGDMNACSLAETLRTEILRRWLRKAPAPLHSHRAEHVEVERRLRAVDMTPASTATGGAA